MIVNPLSRGTRRFPLLAAAAASILFTLANAQSSTVTKADPSPTLGIPYHWAVNMGGSDSATLIEKLGAWSWDEDANASTTLGWTHTSNWVALTLTEPALLTLRVEPQDGVPDPQFFGDDTVAGTNIFPGLTLWANQDHDDTAPGGSHVFQNRGASFWAEDLQYIGHIEQVPGAATHVIERTWSLPAGTYTFVVGGSSPAADFEGNQGYKATITTAVPEPGSAMLMLVAGTILGLRRRRA